MLPFFQAVFRVPSTSGASKQLIGKLSAARGIATLRLMECEYDGGGWRKAHNPGLSLAVLAGGMSNAFRFASPTGRWPFDRFMGEYELYVMLFYKYASCDRIDTKHAVSTSLTGV